MSFSAKNQEPSEIKLITGTREIKNQVKSIAKKCVKFEKTKLIKGIRTRKLIKLILRVASRET